VGEAFTVVDAEGNQQDATFVSLLCVAADLAAMSDELDSARSLYMRAHQLGSSIQADGALIAKALVGVGSLYEADGELAKAGEHYREALTALGPSRHEDAEVARAAIGEALDRVSQG
jgi:tetratricopeptide (TPR) repeat protein